MSADRRYQAWQVTVTCVVTDVGFDPMNDHIEVHGKHEFDPQYHVVDVEAVRLHPDPGHLGETNAARTFAEETATTSMLRKAIEEEAPHDDEST